MQTGVGEGAGGQVDGGLPQAAAAGVEVGLAVVVGEQVGVVLEAGTDGALRGDQPVRAGDGVPHEKNDAVGVHAAVPVFRPLVAAVDGEPEFPVCAVDLRRPKTTVVKATRRQRPGVDQPGMVLPVEQIVGDEQTHTRVRAAPDRPRRAGQKPAAILFEDEMVAQREAGVADDGVGVGRSQAWEIRILAGKPGASSVPSPECTREQRRTADPVAQRQKQPHAEHHPAAQPETQPARSRRSARGPSA